MCYEIWQVQISDGTLTDTVPAISDADIQLSHQRVSAFLTSHSAYELLPESGKVWMFYYGLFMGIRHHCLWRH